MKRYYIENLPKEYTEEEYARQVIRIAKRWKREMNVKTAEATARESCRIRKNDIESVLRRKWNALNPKPELTVDEISEIFEDAADAHELPNEWIPLPPTWKRKYWGTCCFRDVGGSCPRDVGYICAILPFDCTGGSDMRTGDQDGASIFHNEYNENFVCDKDYKDSAGLHRMRIYKRHYFPALIEQWKKDDAASKKK